MHISIDLDGIALHAAPTGGGKSHGRPTESETGRPPATAPMPRDAQSEHRAPHDLAHDAACRIIHHLRVNADCERIEIAGSLRRKAPDCGDIDILVAAADSRAVLDCVEHSRFVVRTICKGTVKGSFEVALDHLAPDSGKTIQCDVRIVPAESFGAALQYFTGPREHNIALRRHAMSLGLKLNEYGVWRGDERIAGETEDGVYAALGVPYPQPGDRR